ncbi:MAG: hypothetical protein HY391_00430, partial [Deltaproteobacteria bacterium]|nr:hypothetical protein [Deltaproteobacteria bacterium]
MREPSRTQQIGSTPEGGEQVLSGHATKGPLDGAKIIARIPSGPEMLPNKVVAEGIVQKGEFRLTLSERIPEGTPVLLEVSGGSYPDEVTGYLLPLEFPLRLVTSIRNGKLEYTSLTIFSTLAANWLLSSPPQFLREMTL